MASHLSPVRLAFLPTPYETSFDAESLCLEAGSFIAILVEGRFRPAGPWSNVVGGPLAFRWASLPAPLSYLLRCVEALSHPGELVVDPFLGGGTTAVACAQLGRRVVAATSTRTR